MPAAAAAAHSPPPAPPPPERHASLQRVGVDCGAASASAITAAVLYIKHILYIKSNNIIYIYPNHNFLVESSSFQKLISRTKILSIFLRKDIKVLHSHAYNSDDVAYERTGKS